MECHFTSLLLIHLVSFTINILFEVEEGIQHEQNKVEFLNEQFPVQKLSSVRKKKTGHSLELSISIFVSFNGVFLTLKCETLVLKTTAWGER